MNHSFQVGLSFGLTSGVITTLGLIVGLYAGTHSGAVVIGGVLTIAIADSLSDALGIHVSEESESIHTQKEVWMATFSAFISKFLCALSFLIPLLLFPIKLATLMSIAWGIFLIAIFSYMIAKQNKANPYPMMLEHIALSLLVIVLTYITGQGINNFVEGL